MSLVALLILLIVFCLVVWAVRALLSAFAVPDPINTVVWVLVVLIAVFILLGQFGLIGANPGIHLR